MRGASSLLLLECSSGSHVTSLGPEAAQDYYFHEWFFNADPSFLGPGVFKGATRPMLFSALLFNFGYTPTDPPPSKLVLHLSCVGGWGI